MMRSIAGAASFLYTDRENEIQGDTAKEVLGEAGLDIWNFPVDKTTRVRDGIRITPLLITPDGRFKGWESILGYISFVVPEKLYLCATKQHQENERVRTLIGRLGFDYTEICLDENEASSQGFLARAPTLISGGEIYRGLNKIEGYFTKLEGREIARIRERFSCLDSLLR